MFADRQAGVRGCENESSRHHVFPPEVPRGSEEAETAETTTRVDPGYPHRTACHHGRGVRIRVRRHRHHDPTRPRR